MEKRSPAKKVLKLSDYDRRILLAYSNSLLEAEQKLTSKATVGSNCLRMA